MGSYNLKTISIGEDTYKIKPEDATQSSSGLMSAKDKTKLDGIASGANINTHRPVKMNGTQILGNNTTALDLIAGSNIDLSNSSGAITITATDTTYSVATPSVNGLMSTADKIKVDNLVAITSSEITTIFSDL